MNVQKKKTVRMSILTVALVLVVVIALNVVLWLLPERRLQKDMTKEQFYTLSDKIDDFLINLDEDVTLYLIDADGSDDKFEYFIERLTDRSDRLTLKKLKLEDCEEQLKKWGISTDSVAATGYCLVAEGEKRTEIVDYSSMFYYEVTNATLNSMGMTKLSMTEYMYYASYFSQDAQYEQYLAYLVNESYRYFQGETVIAAMLEYVVADVIPVHYVVTGHGERSFASSTIEELYTYHGTSYQTLDLRMTKRIPEDASTLLILAPKTDYSKSDISMLKAYLERGGQITVLTDEENLSMPNLMSLMASYGMTATAGAVGERVAVKSEENGAEESYEYSTSVSATINTQHDSLASLDQLSSLPTPVITGGNAIALDNSAESSLILTPLLTTSENAYIGTATDSLEKRVLAAAAETANGAHLLWYTGAESYMVAKETITEENLNSLSNNYCLYMPISWTNLVYQSQLEFPDAVIYEAGYLQAVQSDVTIFGVLMILIIPVAVIVCGVVVVRRRRKRV